jgi:hypothetical protein
LWFVLVQRGRFSVSCGGGGGRRGDDLAVRDDDDVAQMPSAAGLANLISFGMLAEHVRRDVIDRCAGERGLMPRRSDAKLPPHVMVYFVMGLALWADEDYASVMTRLVEALEPLGCWDPAWTQASTSGLAQARQRLGAELFGDIFTRVARPVATADTRGAFIGGWRAVSVDGFEWDVPDTKANAQAFGYAGVTRGQTAAFPKARVVTLNECADQAPLAAAIGPVAGKSSGEQSQAADLWNALEEDMMVLADRNFYSFPLWCAAADTGAQLLWRVASNLTLAPVGWFDQDGTYLSVVMSPQVRGKARAKILDAARRGEELDASKARYVRVIEYTLDQGDDELLCLITTVTDPAEASGRMLAAAYSQRWDGSEGAGQQIKTWLRGPGRVLRSKSPDMVRQEIWGYLLTHYALAALICRLATEADLDPDRISFLRTVRLVRRHMNVAAFPP